MREFLFRGKRADNGKWVDLPPLPLRGIQLPLLLILAGTIVSTLGCLLFWALTML